MAGYIFSIASDGWSNFCSGDLRIGAFTPLTLEVSASESTDSKRKSGNKILAAIFADLVTMTPGDNVYFLSQRKIFGIGRTVKIGDDCKYDNYLDASALLPNDQVFPNSYLTTKKSSARWVVLFEPAPHFFARGVDMDDVLSFRPSAFKSLRAFEGVSFIKIDDDENRALREFISLKNEADYSSANHLVDFDASTHDKLASTDLSPYLLNIHKALLNDDNKRYVFSEMLIEALLLQHIKTNANPSLGKWDYLTHQLIASPFKPLKYIDKIDIFGYQFSRKYQDTPRLVTKFLLVELKKDHINADAVKQTMQYVDWVCKEYASGDYSRIEAFIVGDRPVARLGQVVEDLCQRSFISETHPVRSEKWSGLKLVSYTLEPEVSFQIVNPN